MTGDHGARRLLPHVGRRAPLVLLTLGLAMPVRAGDAAAVSPSVPIAEDAATVAKVRAALSAGDCKGALETATTRTAAVPQDATAHRLRGDALRCLDRPRDAVLAYRRAVELGATDALLPQLISQVSRGLVTLKIAIPEYDPSFPPEILLQGQGLDPESKILTSNMAEFTDLPAGVPFVLRLKGIGYAPETLEVPPQKPGSSASFKIGSDYRGVGRVVLAPWSGGLTVTLTDVRGAVSGLQPGVVPVTTGEVVLKVSGPTGDVSQTFTVARNATVEANPGSLAPAQMTLAHVPAGSTITWAPADDGPSQEIQTGWTDPGIETDPTTGVPVIAAIPLRGLRSGSYTLRMTQPWLGVVNGEFFAVGGEVGAYQVPWQETQGAKNVRAAWTDWKAKEAAASRPTRHTTLGRVGIGVTSLGAAALVTGLVEGLLVSSRIDRQTADYESALVLGNTEEARGLFESRASLQRTGLLSWVGAGVGGALTAGGLVFTIHSFRVAKGEKITVSPWDLQNLPPVQTSSSAEGGSR
jgi:hypothetical protein